MKRLRATVEIPVHRSTIACAHCRGWVMYDRLDEEWRCLQCGRLAVAGDDAAAGGNPVWAA